jgi:hypothetical protein
MDEKQSVISNEKGVLFIREKTAKRQQRMARRRNGG